MKNSIEITRKYQFGYMILTHLKALGICAVFEAVVCWGFLAQSPGKYIVGSIFGLVYAGVLFAGARKLANFDRKPYTPLKPEIKWGAYWGIMISASYLLFVFVNILVWHICNVQEQTASHLAIVLNSVYIAWNIPYVGLLPLVQAAAPVWYDAIVIAVPLIVCPVGYYTGMKNIDILSKLDALTVEKEDNDET